ncbi:polysaccharide biosynthesis/export family protein [Mucilaginibacter glaciei]|uniref:Polysaccharide biosynthesis/export family protein n=1 Tax=Mucilaginibacter glaciei TaxID=2772109 RepID=A0A926NRB7_9SPHI|nr:polysaccharide biosynthesis/export family protein [Mucilaginibacter glaciei]MBD1393290.1 polysaccharide biosynthesis/export family protein [Mucilaginibacter glaciei]
MKKNYYSLFIILLAFISLSSLNSCVTAKKITYFNNILTDSVADIPPNKLQTVISRNDLLSINISTPDAATNALLNSRQAVNEAAGAGGVSGYLVDENGELKIPLIGTVKAAGLTKIQLANTIAEQLVSKKLAKDPIVNIRVVNFKITVIGEVTRPGVIQIPNERVTLPEAIGFAGDLTPFGKRDNVLLIREVGGKRIFKRFSLNKDQMFDPSIYNLQNQDVIYVEPNSARAANADRFTQLVPILFSSISVIVLLYSIFFR